MEDADYEASRKKLKAEMDAAFAEHCKSLPFYKEFEEVKSRRSFADEGKENVESDNVKITSPAKPRTPRRRASFYQPVRKSMRAKKLRSNEDSLYVESSDDELLSGLDDERVSKLKGRRRRLPVNLAPRYTQPPGVDEVTPYMLDNINYKGMAKIWCKTAAGSTCHQCRQKTLDTKTVCRSGRCVGVRGQFCGPCLLNRHGERVSDALLNPCWQCPCCLGLCNCSFCMKKAGLDPTGCVFPLLGPEYSSVREFLAAEQSYPLPQGPTDGSGSEDSAPDSDAGEDSTGEESVAEERVLEMKEERLDELYAMMFPAKPTKSAKRRRRKHKSRKHRVSDKDSEPCRGLEHPIASLEALRIIQCLLDRDSAELPLPFPGFPAPLDDPEPQPFLGFEEPIASVEAELVMTLLVDRAAAACDSSQSPSACADDPEAKPFLGFEQPIASVEAELVVQRLVDRAVEGVLPRERNGRIHYAFDFELEPFLGFPPTSDGAELEPEQTC